MGCILKLSNAFKFPWLSETFQCIEIPLVELSYDIKIPYMTNLPLPLPVEGLLEVVNKLSWALLIPVQVDYFILQFYTKVFGFLQVLLWCPHSPHLLHLWILSASLIVVSCSLLSLVLSSFLRSTSWSSCMRWANFISKLYLLPFILWPCFVWIE